MIDQLADADSRGGGGWQDVNLTAPVAARRKAVLTQLGVDSHLVLVAQVNFVQRDDDGDAGRLRMVYRLDGLRHHPIISRNHQHDDVGYLGTAGPHRRERFVARGV